MFLPAQAHPLHFLFSLPLLELIPSFLPKFVKILGTPSSQVFTKVSNFIISSLIARLARSMLYKYSDFWVIVWENYMGVYSIYMQTELKLTS